MGRSCLGPPALVAAAGLAPSGSSRTLVPPPTKACAPRSRQRPEWLTSLGLGTGILVASDSGAVELWELDKNQTLIVSESCKYEHDDIVSTVSVLSSGTQVAKTSAHSGQVTCVTASPHKDSMFLLCGEDNRILLWDIHCPKPALQMGCTASGYLPTSLAWHPQQSEVFVFGVESGTVSLVDTKSAKCALSSAVHSCVTGLVFSPHRIPFLAAISEDCSLAVLDSGLSEVFRSQAHRDFVRDAVWSPLNHSLLTTVGWDHQVIHHILPTEPLAALGPKSVSE